MEVEIKNNNHHYELVEVSEQNNLVDEITI
jgi:hypothetical protein